MKGAFVLLALGVGVVIGLEVLVRRRARDEAPDLFDRMRKLMEG